MTYRTLLSVLVLITAPSPKPAEPCSTVGFPYEPRPPSDEKASLPKVPALQDRPTRVGNVYSVWGASYSLRSRVHRNNVQGKEIEVQGYIIKTNLLEAPRCAVHTTNRASPEGCRAPYPTFWLADDPRAAIGDAIMVMGWASSYAQVFDAIRVFDSADVKPYGDSLWGVYLPNPLPAVGAKVVVKGLYDSTFLDGTESDPDMGILNYREIRVVTPAPGLATLPGVRRKKR